LHSLTLLFSYFHCFSLLSRDLPYPHRILPVSHCSSRDPVSIMSTEEKVEMEAVPLKTDTDETKTETAETAVDKKEAPKKTWFFSKPAKKVIEEENVEEGKEKTKKKCFWRCEKKEKKEGEEEDKPEMSIGIDLINRDDKQINNHVNINFGDVYGEPETFHQHDCIWRLNYRIFEGVRTCFYKLFCLFCIPFTVLFALFFALFAAINNHIVMPLAKLASIPLAWISMAWSFLISNIFDPVANSIGLCFSKIHVRKYGINNAPTDLIQA
ncbi:hypothetical protein PENTCL1PPCAC_17375, partial [Pristionchus entomophagus]